MHGIEILFDPWTWIKLIGLTVAMLVGLYLTMPNTEEEST